MRVQMRRTPNSLYFCDVDDPASRRQTVLGVEWWWRWNYVDGRWYVFKPWPVVIKDGQWRGEWLLCCDPGVVPDAVRLVARMEQAA